MSERVFTVIGGVCAFLGGLVFLAWAAHDIIVLSNIERKFMARCVAEKSDLAACNTAWFKEMEP